MGTELIIGIVGGVFTVFTSIITYLFGRRKTNAEAMKIIAEADSIKVQDEISISKQALEQVKSLQIQMNRMENDIGHYRKELDGYRKEIERYRQENKSLKKVIEEMKVKEAWLVEELEIKKAKGITSKK